MNDDVPIVVLPIRASSRTTDFLTAVLAAYLLQAIIVLDYDHLGSSQVELSADDDPSTNIT